MYEESESERYRAKLKDEYEVFARNQDVYATLKKLVGFQMVLDLALIMFHCPADELEMDQLHEMEKLLKMGKNRYHAIVSMENQDDNISISSEEEESEQNPVEPEINWRMPRDIPHQQQNNMAQTIPHASYQQSTSHQTIEPIIHQQSMNHQQNVMHQIIRPVSYQPNTMNQVIPYASYQQSTNPQTFASMPRNIPEVSNNNNMVRNMTQTIPHASYQQSISHQTIAPIIHQQSMNHQQNIIHQTIRPVSYQPNTMNQVIPDASYQPQNNLAQTNPLVMHQQNMPTPSLPWNNYAPSPIYPASTIQNASRFVNSSGYLFNQPQHLPNAQHNPQVPSTSRQMPPERQEPRNYREYRCMKLQEEQRENERREKQRKLMLEKQEEEKQERKLINQEELEQSQYADKIEENRNNHLIRKQQIDEYNKREAEELAASTSKQSESGKLSRFSGSFRKEGKKSVTWADIESNKSLTSTDTSENNVSNNTNCEESGSVKSAKSAGSSGLSKSENDKKSTSKSKSAKLKVNEKSKKVSEAETLFTFTPINTSGNNVPNNTNCKDNGSVKSAGSSSSSKKEAQSENGKKSTPTSSKTNDKPKNVSKSEKSASLTSMDTSENNVLINARCEDSGSSGSSSSSKKETQSENGKKSISSKSANSKANDKPKKVSKPKKSVSLPVSKPETSKSQKSDSNKKTDKNKDNVAIDKKDGKKKILQVYHPKPIVYKLIKDCDSLIKRKSEDDPIEDIRQAKRSKKGSDGENVPANSNCDIRDENTIDINIKEEQMSDDENLDGQTDVSWNADNDNVESATVQRMESDHIRIKCEPEEDLDLNETASTLENVDIKEEVMSEIDHDNSSVYSEKEEANEIAENFVSLCENPEILQTITERFIDFSQFENDMTQDAVQNNNNNSKTQIDSQERCASWVEGIQNYDRNLESPDEEAEPNDYIVPYYPVRQLGAPEIVPKEEEL